MLNNNFSSVIKFDKTSSQEIKRNMKEVSWIMPAFIIFVLFVFILFVWFMSSFYANNASAATVEMSKNTFTGSATIQANTESTLNLSSYTGDICNYINFKDNAFTISFQNPATFISLHVDINMISPASTVHVVITAVPPSSSTNNIISLFDEDVNLLDTKTGVVNVTTITDLISNTAYRITITLDNSATILYNGAIRLNDVTC